MNLKRNFPTVFLLFLPIFFHAQTVLTPGFTTNKTIHKNDQHIYQLNLKKGERIDLTVQQKGVDLHVVLLSSEGDTLETFDSPNGINGPEIIDYEALENDHFQLIVEALPPQSEGVTDPIEIEKYLEENQGPYSIEKVNILSAEENQRRKNQEAAALEQVVQWFADKAVPLKTAQAESGLEDLAFLKPILKEVTIVGLGECTHGTREFFQMKHRILEFLVKEMGFTIFAIEASYSACLNINDYVLHGKGSKEEALTSQGFWTWDTEEILDMIEWIRQYNLTVPPKQQVKFYGVDVQIPEDPALRITPALLEIDTLLNISFDLLKAAQKRAKQLNYISHKATFDSITTAGYALLAKLYLNQGSYSQSSSPENVALLLENMRIYLHSWEANLGFLKRQQTGIPGIEWRDYYMAENVQYLINKAPAGSKMVLWAHNGHVNADPETYINGGRKPMGAYLKEQYGDAYFTMAFIFNQGGFQAFNMGVGGLKGFEVAEAEKPHTEWILSQAKHPISFINLRGEKPEFISEYLKNDVQFIDIGAMFGDDWGRPSYPHPNFNRRHDSLIFIDKTTRAIPSKSIKTRMKVE